METSAPPTLVNIGASKFEDSHIRAVFQMKILEEKNLDDKLMVELEHERR